MKYNLLRYIIIWQASGEITHADWLRSTFTGPLLSRIGPAVHYGKKTNKQQTRHFKTTNLKNLSRLFRIFDLFLLFFNDFDLFSYRFRDIYFKKSSEFNDVSKKVERPNQTKPTHNDG